MGIKMTRIGATLALALALTACGGGGGKGDKEAEDNRSSYEQLVAMPAELDAAIMAVTSPIDSVDGILAQLGELPGKTKLTKEALGELISGRFQGKPFAAPEGMDAAAATELDTFLGSLDTFKNNIMATPENAKALVMKVGESIVTVPVLATKIAAESGVALASPFASKAEKAKAKTEKDGADKAKNETLAAIEKAKATATGLPARSVAAVGKFIGGLGDFGVTEAVMGTVDDSKKAAEDAVEGAKDSVE
jgi:hypothetical protein